MIGFAISDSAISLRGSSESHFDTMHYDIICIRFIAVTFHMIDSTDMTHLAPNQSGRAITNAKNLYNKILMR